MGLRTKSCAFKFLPLSRETSGFAQQPVKESPWRFVNERRPLKHALPVLSSHVMSLSDTSSAARERAAFRARGGGGGGGGGASGYSGGGGGGGVLPSGA